MALRRSTLRAIVLVACAAALLPGLAARASAPEELTWAVVDGPPYHLPGASGQAQQPEQLGAGATDRLIREIAARLPQYRHRIVYLSRVRLWQDLRSGRPLCYADAFKSRERLAWAWFSAATPTLPHALVSRKGSFPPEAKLSLRALLERNDLSGAVERTRSYGPRLDGLLQTAGPHLQRTPLPTTPQLLLMLAAGRMDFLLEHPIAVQRLLSQLAEPPALDFHALEEETEPPPAHVVCTRNAWGRAAIGAVDQALRDWASQPEAAAALLRWLPPSLAQRHAERVERFYRERAGRSDIE